MDLSLKYSVHRASVQMVRQKVELRDGSTAEADIETLEVELTNSDGHGTLVLRFFGKDLEPARARFTRSVPAATGGHARAPIEGPVVFTLGGNL